VEEIRQKQNRWQWRGGWSGTAARVPATVEEGGERVQFRVIRLLGYLCSMEIEGGWDGDINPAVGGDAAGATLELWTTNTW
jgi:hypothetical protein